MATFRKTPNTTPPRNARPFIEGRVMDLEDKLSRAEVIDVSKLSGKTVKFGATVTLSDEDTDEKVKYQIVGDLEAEAKHGRISISSPIARALIGKAAGDTVEVAPQAVRAPMKSSKFSSPDNTPGGMLMRKGLVLAGLLAFGLATSTAALAVEINVYSAGALQEAERALAAEFTDSTGHKVNFTIGTVGQIQKS
jgi:transcription elongation GreA/GreB family factor